MKKQIATILVTFVVTITLFPWAVGAARHDYGFVDSQVAFYGVSGGGTLYGDMFTEERFQSVSAGMSRGEVRELLGEPMVRPWIQGPEGNPSKWWYAFQRRPGFNAHRRCVEFGDDERVSGVIAEPNID